MTNFTEVVRSKVISAIDDFSMLSNVDNVVVGFSGGADSLCLLHLLKMLENDFSYIVTAAHLNHGIRGDEAERDQNFCRAFCEQNNIPFYTRNIDCVSLASVNGETIEECGRRERYAFFNSVCSDNCCKIATAHNSNDNAETVIFNLCRGSALKGVCGIPPVRDNIIRPLIYCSREEIEGYCSENSLAYVTDSTNLSDDYTRNNIRHNVLPNLAKVNSAYLNKITEFSSYATELSSYMTVTASEKLSEAFIGEGVYDADYLLSLHKALCAECIVVAFARFSDLTLTRQKINEIYSLLSKKGRIQIYGDIYCEVVKNKFRFFCFEEKKNDKISISLTEESFEHCYNGYIVKFERLRNDEIIINKKTLDNLIDCDKIVGNLYISSRSSGDEFTFHNRKITKSIKKLFNEIGVPVEKRDNLPVLYDDEGIVWVFGVGTNLRCRVNNEANNIILVLGEE